MTIPNKQAYLINLYFFFICDSSRLMKNVSKKIRKFIAPDIE